MSAQNAGNPRPHKWKLLDLDPKKEAPRPARSEQNGVNKSEPRLPEPERPEN
jgi:hypothetical protein